MSTETEVFSDKKPAKIKNAIEWIKSANWIFIAMFFLIYFGGFYGLYYLLTGKAKFYTYLWVYNVFVLGGIGLGIGVHRYFCHRSFKATKGLHIFLIICQTITGQLSIVSWTRIHRAHHKYIDTDRDPTNVKRGFLFSHFYWLFNFSPECKHAMATAYVKDLEADKYIMFQYRHFVPLFFIFSIILPTVIPYLLWSESLWIGFWTNIWRWCINWNQMSVANSLMHMYGRKPYNKNISAGDEIFSIIFTYGEGYHNYHHIFPWDYKAAEFGDILHFNYSTMIIDLFAKFGWAYDRKVVTQKMIERRKAKTGDGTNWVFSEELLKNPVWGYGDTDMDYDDEAELMPVNDENNNSECEKIKSSRELYKFLEK